MAHIHKKMKNGRPYYYVREMARVDGKPKVINQVYLGSPARILEMAQGKSDLPSKLQTQEFGSLWLANLVEQEIGIAGIIDGIIPQAKGAGKPSIGDYFLYAIYNRMVAACSKRAMPEWYKHTAIQHIRPVQISELNSQKFWLKWDQVSEEHLTSITEEFFRRVNEIEPPASDCFMFDTTNYYTFMASQTDSKLAQRGKSKEGRNWLRQIGLALLVDRDKRIPFYYKEYKGNCHDSKVFLDVAGDLFSVMRKETADDTSLTIVFDKGMNSEENIAAIDAKENVHFITTYSTYFGEKLASTKLDLFTPLDTEKNKKLIENDKHDDLLQAYRTTGEYWGKQRTVIVTYNPLTAAKQRYGFEKRLLKLQDFLFEMQSKVSRGTCHWRNKATIEKRYKERCAELHLPSDIYKVEISVIDGALAFNFKKNYYKIERYIERLGKNILITDIEDWETEEIVQASLDRWAVEEGFRLTKDEEQIAMRPIRHWTDSKIRCHIFTCIAALTLLRLIELRLRRAGLNITAKTAMQSMRQLHSCLLFMPKKKETVRMLEDPDDLQGQIIRTFGAQIVDGVLQR
ncbi:IS1634 family transposase [Desulfogranum marinum]|uniref:IS1634 family transposase n=1 Tax=Desulfogranum marinum TaxID=453220 RepID=UPI0029C623A3|nr:IS1634 family transposase [Desulfogranum marinum]